MQNQLYDIAFTRLTGLNLATATQIYRELGNGKAIYDHRNDIGDIMPDCNKRLISVLADWDDALKRAEAELAFVEKHSIKVLCMGDDEYPVRLRDCEDAPTVLYYLGNTDLNQRRVINIVGTRKATNYGFDLIRHLIADLKQSCPEVLIVSGLAYGVDICAHTEALRQGYDTVGVLAHGLDDLYPSSHRETARQMISQGGLLTEYMSQTRPDKVNFVRRNRIVAGMCDATVLVESAAHGGGLITAGIAADYNRDVFAFPGAVGAKNSEGCNNLIRDNGAQLITCADDMIRTLGWQTDRQLSEAKTSGIERQLFPDLSPEETAVVKALDEGGDMLLNHLSVKTNLSVGSLTALLFQLEMKGIIKPLAGGAYHLLK